MGVTEPFHVSAEIDSLNASIGVVDEEARLLKKKSVTVITDDGHRSNVSPSFLRLAESTLEAAKTQEGAHPSTVILFKQKMNRVVQQRVGGAGE
jgi:hypothetical protein